jgi:LacI family transcriptional regulator
VKRARPTIIDVAAHSGVSKSTVSNVIRGHTAVSPGVRERVLAAVSELGYRPNGIARQLVQRRTSTLGVFVGDLGNPFYGELVKLFERHVQPAGFTTMVCNTDGIAAREATLVEALLERRVAGLAVLQHSGEDELIETLRAEALPAVVLSSTEPRLDSVAVDEHKGVSLAVEHLARLGHRRIAYVTSGYVEERTNLVRHGGFADGCAAHGCIEAPPLTIDVDGVLAGAAPEIDDEATGFVAANDLTAIALVEALGRVGRTVPHDASVVGFDGIALTALAGVGLTTVAQPRAELARVGARMVLERIHGSAVAPRRVVLEPKLVVRTTTAGLR